MKKFLTLSALIMSAAAIQGQDTTAMKVTGADLGVFADKVTKSIPKDTDVKAYAGVSAVSGATRWQADARASTSLRHHVSKWSGRLSASVSDFASAKAGHAAGTSKVHQVTVTFKNAKKGVLTLSYYGRVYGGGTASASAAAKGFTTFTAKADGKRQTASWKLPAGSTTIVIDSAADANAATAKTGASASGGLSLMFQPELVTTKCTVMSDKASCAEGGKLVGTPSTAMGRHTVKLGLTGAKLAEGFAITLVSGKGDTGTLPGSKCIVLSMPMWAGFAMVSKTGTAAGSLRFSAMKPITAYAQMLTLKFGKTLELASSNTLKIECK